MKNVYLIIVLMFLLIFIIGCGGSNSAKVSYIAVKSISGGGDVGTNRITPEQVPDPDGKNGKFNANTKFYCAQTAGDFHSTLYLQVFFYDTQGQEVSVSWDAPVNWTHDFSAEETRLGQNTILQITTNSIGVHTVTAEYQGLISTNTVVVVKRFFTGDQRYCGCKLKLSDYDENSSSPDITSSFDTVAKIYTLNAPNGIAVQEVMDSIYLDRDPRQKFCEIATVPTSGLTWVTQLTIPEDKTVICFAQDAAGGTAKILFSQGLNFFYRCLDTYIEYIGPGQTNFVCHF